MKAAELKCQNLIVKKVCQVEHFKAFRSDRPIIRPVKTKNKRHRGEVRDRVHKENYSIDLGLGYVVSKTA